MPVLQQSEYDDAYFGLHPTLSHSAGYGKRREDGRSSYSMIQYGTKSAGVGHIIETSRGTVFGQYAQSLNINNRFIGKNVLVLGCAFGYLVKELRDMGINADGIDWSPEAVAQTDPSIASYVRIENALVSLADSKLYKRNAYDFIISRWFLECIDNADLPGLISSMNRISRNQLHIVFPNTNPAWYNVKALSEWQQEPFAVGTILIPGDNFSDYVTVIN